MKHLIIIVVLSFTLLSCDNITNIKEIEEKAYAAGYKEGRWVEKQRWTTYQNDSIKWPYIHLQLRILGNKMGYQEAFHKAGDLIMRTTNPFTTY